MKKILLLLTVITLVFSCKKEEKSENTIKTIEQVETIKNEFIVKVNFKTNINDQFTLSLKNIKKDEFQTKTISITENVTPTTSVDNITANFGDNISSNFNINFGRKNTKTIFIESITLEYGDNLVNILSADLEKHFRFSKYLSFDEASGELTTKKIENRHIPIMFLKKATYNKLIKGNKK